MKRLIFTPREIKDKTVLGVKKEIVSYIEDVVFSPVRDILAMESHEKERTILNNVDTSLILAMKNRAIRYKDGKFVGKFDSSTSKELREIGAIPNKEDKSFTINKDDVPYYILIAASLYSSISDSVYYSLYETFDGIEENLYSSSTGIKVDSMFSDISKTVSSDVRKFAKQSDIEHDDGVNRYDSDESIKNVYMESLDSHAKGVAGRSITTLREKIKENEEIDGGLERISEIVESVFGLAKSRATYIARQEIGMFRAKTIREKFSGMGCESYIWATQCDDRVRNDHAYLEGKMFSWDSPPITNISTGDRNHPSEDYNCRCYAKPVISVS